MTINSTSVILSRFNYILSQAKNKKQPLTDTVVHLEQFRASGFTGHHLAYATHFNSDGPLETALDMMKHLTWGSPKARYILDQINTWALELENGRIKKILITEDIPICAYFYELLCKALYIRCETMHSGLSDAQRADLNTEFNDVDSDLVVLIAMYQVNSQGANMDKACRRVIVATSAINAAIEFQAIHRPARVSTALLLSMVYRLTQH